MLPPPRILLNFHPIVYDFFFLQIPVQILFLPPFQYLLLSIGWGQGLLSLETLHTIGAQYLFTLTFLPSAESLGLLYSFHTHCLYPAT